MSFPAKQFRQPGVWLRLCVGLGLSLLFLLSPALLVARLMKDSSFKEMFTKSDLVVIAMPIATFETREHTTLKEIDPGGSCGT